jgi:hypothetical protein
MRKVDREVRTNSKLELIAAHIASIKVTRPGKFARQERPLWACMFYDQDDNRAGFFFGFDIVEWSLLLGAIALVALFGVFTWTETTLTMSARHFLKIAARIYVAQAAVAFAIGFTLPFLRYFGLWWVGANLFLIDLSAWVRFLVS